MPNPAASSGWGHPGHYAYEPHGPYERREGPPPHYTTPSPYHRPPPPSSPPDSAGSYFNSQNLYLERAPSYEQMMSSPLRPSSSWETYEYHPPHHYRPFAAPQSHKATGDRSPHCSPAPRDFCPPLGNGIWKEEKKSKKKKDGDPLALLAKVSSTMEDSDDEEEEGRSSPVPSTLDNRQAPPTSPLQRTSQAPPETPPKPKKRGGPKAVTPGHTESKRGPPEMFHYPPGPPPDMPHMHFRGPPPPGYWEYPPSNRNSFDSNESTERRHRPPRGHYYYGGPPPPEYYYHRPSPPGPYGPPPPPGPYGPPPRGWHEQPPHPYGGPPPPYAEGAPPSRRGPPPPPPMMAPYAFAQQQHQQSLQGMEEKTILRKKFSWKHYPELERFLIAHRDEYLEHSSKNYTAEQKSYNNWLTNQLLTLASRHNYVFDPEAFNFVAIRDRIRCYYKSYVQTARKRGLPLPAGKAKKARQDDKGSTSASASASSPKIKVKVEDEAVETVVGGDSSTGTGAQDDDVSMKDDVAPESTERSNDEEERTE